MISCYLHRLVFCIVFVYKNSLPHLLYFLHSLHYPSLTISPTNPFPLYHSYPSLLPFPLPCSYQHSYCFYFPSRSPSSSRTPSRTSSVSPSFSRTRTPSITPTRTPNTI